MSNGTPNMANLNAILQWSLKHSEPSSDGSTTASTGTPSITALDPDKKQFLESVLNAPSQAELMLEAMRSVENDKLSEEERLIAFDNFDQLIECIDNANNMASLDLWAALMRQLAAETPALRAKAASCVATAVQNNDKAQKSFYEIPEALNKLIDMAINDPHTSARKKALFALSSIVRNFPPAFEVLLKRLRAEDLLPPGKFDPDDASNMSSVDEIMDYLRVHLLQQSSHPSQLNDTESNTNVTP